ncbi:MAG: glycosyltransferase family 2 protein [Planctomycetes bacterium]|nr:glycosyltransferase family 2 protein [Planctomycetota bacterium]
MFEVATQPEVAVVVPCYRYAHLLPEAVRSVVAQTWQNLHIVIVDDGSPDDTAVVAERLIAEFPNRRIELVRQPNLGLATARNNGVRLTRAAFVLPLDADDELVPNAIERLMVVQQATGADVVTPLGRTFGDEDRQLVTLPVTSSRLCAGNCLVYSSLYRRELFDRIGGYTLNVPGYEDWDFWLAGFERGAKFAHVPEELFRYRRHGTTMLTTSDQKAMHLRATIVSNHPRLYARWRVAVAQRWLRAGERPRGWLRLLMLAQFLLDRRLKLFWRQLRAV